MYSSRTVSLVSLSVPLAGQYKSERTRAFLPRTLDYESGSYTRPNAVFWNQTPYRAR
jgi:hypothetical protein